MDTAVCVCWWLSSGWISGATKQPNSVYCQVFCFELEATQSNVFNLEPLSPWMQKQPRELESQNFNFSGIIIVNVTYLNLRTPDFANNASEDTDLKAGFDDLLGNWTLNYCSACMLHIYNCNKGWKLYMLCMTLVGVDVWNIANSSSPVTHWCIRWFGRMHQRLPPVTFFSLLAAACFNTNRFTNRSDGFWCVATIPGSGWCSHAQMCLFLMQIIHLCAVIFLCHVFSSVSELLFIWDCYSGDVFTDHLCSVRWHLHMKRISTDKLVVWVMQPCRRISTFNL